MKTAKLVLTKPDVPGAMASDRVSKRLYLLSEPISFCNSDGVCLATDHVIVSAATVMGWAETYVFPADASGTILDWVELHGSFKGGLDHERALREAGYEVHP